MTNDPRYSPPPQQPGYRAPNQPVPPAYAQGQQPPYNQQFDWRYPQSSQSQPSQPTQTTQFRQRYEPFGGTGPGRIPGGTGPGPIPGGTGTGPIGMLPPMPPHPGQPQKRSRAGLLTVGAVAIAVVSAGIGGAAATVVELGTHSASGGGRGDGDPSLRTMCRMQPSAPSRRCGAARSAHASAACVRVATGESGGNG